MSSWLWIVLSVPRTWLIVLFPEVVDRQISGMSWRSCYTNIVYKNENALCLAEVTTDCGVKKGGF